MAAQRESWTFEEVNPDASGSSGKISDLFRNEGGEAFGHLAANGPSVAATLMAREVIQNSWDAAQELRTPGSSFPPFALDFEFHRVEGDQKEALIGALGLRQLAAHAARVVDGDDDRRKRLGLGTDDCLRDLDERASIDYCRIVEHGAKGMYGPWKGAKSRMYLAMLSIGYNEKADGSGGTFGYGKAGLIRASHPRLVVAYSCFPEQTDDPGITRRLLGVTYWGRHDDAAGKALSGFARFGDELEPGQVRPFVNDEADAVARTLGFDARDPARPENLGTTFLVLDPSVGPDDLREAVERNWWPALLDEKFTVLVTDPSGASYPCRPRKNAQLASYIAASELIKTEAGTSPTEKLVDLGTYAPQGAPRRRLGRLALVADPAGWSFPDEAGGVEVGDSRSLIALARGPRMVVEYHLPGRDISRRTPYVRGVFVADDEVNHDLGLTEPKAHDKWDNKRSDDVPSTSTAIAGEILKRIRDEVKRFQEDLRPPVDETGATRLQRLDDKLKRLWKEGGDNAPPPPHGERPFRFSIDVERRAAGDDLVLSGKVHVELSSAASEDELRSNIRIAFALDEDGRRGDEVPLSVVAPRGFALVDGDTTRWVGVVGRQRTTFEIESDSYRNDWTGELLVSGEVVG